MTEGRPVSSDARLLAFLAPGITHALGNQLFAIRSAGLLLSRDSHASSASDTMREALDNAEGTLEICRLLSEPRLDGKRVQAGVMLTTLAGLCRVPLRDRSLRLEIDHSSCRTPREVDAARFVRGVVEILCGLAEELPEFVDGALHLDLSEQADDEILLTLRIAPKDALLPFPLELQAIAARAESALSRLGGGAEATGPMSLCLRLPAD